MHVNNEAVQDRCPLCTSSDIVREGELSYCGKVEFSTNKIELGHHPELWKCRNCLSGFVQHTVDADTARILYSTGQAGERWSTAPFAQNKTREVVECMEAIFSNKGSVLDVGCNTGEMLDFAQGFGCKTAGVEYSSASREVLAGKGHGAYASLEEAPGGYDVITAFDLVEHLYDVPAFVNSCRGKLAENGRLIILTGDIGSLSAVLAGHRWWYAQYPEHIVFPSNHYFYEFSGMRIEKWISTYASKGYWNPVHKIVWGMLKGLLRRRAYTGLPALGPDHVLMVLGK